MNNRQAGRRRGRGGQRPQNNTGRGGDGNRIDNRARGNAAQLLEKYKNLARDAQMQGDRVNTEYYLQFADHYFRVLSDSRSRAEETNRRQRADSDDDDDDFENDGDTRGNDNRGNDNRGERDNRDARGDRDNRGDRETRGERDGRSDEQRSDSPRGQRRNGQSNDHVNGGNSDEDGSDAPQHAAQNDGEGEEKPAPRRRGRPKKEAVQEGAPDATPQGIDADRLPPALSAEASEDEPKPRRRRTVRAKADDSDSASNAA